MQVKYVLAKVKEKYLELELFGSSDSARGEFFRYTRGIGSSLAEELGVANEDVTRERFANEVVGEKTEKLLNEFLEWFFLQTPATRGL